jgi:hypothetical protein
MENQEPTGSYTLKSDSGGSVERAHHDAIRPETAIFLAQSCFEHKFIRSRDTSNVVERPERLRAVYLGLSAALSRLFPPSSEPEPSSDDLDAIFERMQITSSGSHSLPVPIINSGLEVDILNDPAVKFVHDAEGDLHLRDVIRWAEQSSERIASGDSEIPDGFPQGDLYREQTRSSCPAQFTDYRSSLSRIDSCYQGCCRSCVRSHRLCAITVQRGSFSNTSRASWNQACLCGHQTAWSPL